ncbi:MAG: hypothetical protein ACI8TQ_001426, partial [Planctomycetota bacterium]
WPRTTLGMIRAKANVESVVRVEVLRALVIRTETGGKHVEISLVGGAPGPGQEEDDRNSLW